MVHYYGRRLTKPSLYQVRWLSYYRFMERPRTSDVSNLVMVMPNGGASDRALKKNVTEVKVALERILELRSVTWRWKSKQESPVLQHGFIAQELEAVFPELVTEQKWTDGTLRKFVLTEALIPYMIKAFQEQQTQIEALRAQVKALTHEG